MYLVLEKFIPGRFIVPEKPWPGRGTFCLIPGLSRAVRDTWSPYLHHLLFVKVCMTSHHLSINKNCEQHCCPSSNSCIILFINVQPRGLYSFPILHSVESMSVSAALPINLLSLQVYRQP